MKTLFKFTLLIFSLVCYTTNSYAQEWYDLMHQEPVNIEAVKQKAEIYFDKVGRRKHTGYKQYNRWLEGATMNMDKNGVPYTYNHVEDELKKFRANTSNRRAKTLASNATNDADGTWTVMGPFYTDQNNPDATKMAKIDALAVEPIHQQLLFASSTGCGIWRSRDAGASWTPLGDQFDVMFVKVIALDPHNINHVVHLNGNSEVFESLDQGDTWSLVTNFNSGGVGNSAKMISFHPTTPNIYFVTTPDGLMKTTNGGASFTRVVSEEILDVFFKPGDPTTMYSTGKNFWKSTDTGATWTKITNGINASDLMKIAVTPADPNRVYILQADGNAFRQIYKSTNSGTSFEVMAEASKGADNFLGKQAFRCMTIMGSITDPDRLDMAGLQHFRSDNGGATIYRVPDSANGKADIHADVLTMTNVNGTLYATSDGGIFRSTDNGVTYIPLTGNGLVATQIYRMGGTSPFPGTGENVDPDMVLIGCQDNGTSISKGANHIWEYWAAGDGMECFIDYTDDQIIYGSSQNNISKSTNGGGAPRIVLTKPETRPGFGSPTPYTIDPITHTSIYWAYKNLYISKNSGQDWENMTAGYTTDDTFIKGLAIAPTDNNYIYFSENNRLWKSSNAQSNSREWTEIGDFTGLRINYITIDPNDPLHVLTANTGSEIFETKDGGETWADISGNLPDIKANCVLMDNSPENTIYVGMLQGVYYKNDNMTEWKLFGNGLPNADVRELEVHYASKKLRVATYGRGIWEIPIFGSESTTPTPVSSLTTSSLNEFTAEGNSQSITVTSNIDWSISENSSWVTVDATSGSDNGSIEVTTTENTSTENRSVTITITGGEISRSVTVSQAGADEIEVPTSSLTASSLNEFEAEGETQSITITSNIDWSVSENSSWITVDATSGSDNGSIEVTTTENTSTNDRSATITITGGDISRSVSVSQVGAVGIEIPVSTLTASDLNDFAAEGDSQSITVTSNIDWSVSENSSWISVDIASGSNNGTVVVTTSENTSTNDRSADITIIGGELSRSITVTQNGAPEVELPAVNYTSIPALIQAEDFDSQSGTQTEPSGDFRGGQNIGYINEADFLTYNINVIESGNYIIDFRVASPLIRGVNFDIYSEDSLIGSVSSNTTGGWQIWETVSQTVSLNKGMQTIKLVATNNGGWNINWLEFYQEQENAIDTVSPSTSCPEGTNLSLIGTVIDFSSEQNTTNNISNLIDGIDTNRWSVNGFPQFATIDLGEEYPINEVNLATFQNRDYQFIAEGATNASPDDFFTLIDASNNTDTGIIKRIFSAQAVRYVKLTITGANSYTGPWSSIADFKIICAGDISNKNSFAPNADLFEITAFPNPLTDVITVSTANEEQIIGSLQLTDLVGRLIIEETVNANEHTLNNLDSVASGPYLLLVFNTEKQILKTIKIVIE